ncbi:glycosyltransferase family 4 protein [Paenibacillus cellulositrophicus]|uniref:glycosyltransferase family 4 protein n=1 Tax=Paenibacillus cellulositrophicus TaxID=562959 RepID=UPI00203E9B13|nr:glycosyltransferase family 4 protein [Paenibacillus cellulositrophicus]MCM2996932.1 glycosyltransferase family 4 protein [Paenibacillus cellulositrophicus]
MMLHNDQKNIQGTTVIGFRGGFIDWAEDESKKYGIHYAIKEWSRALLKYCSVDNIVYLVPPSEYQVQLQGLNRLIQENRELEHKVALFPIPLGIQLLQKSNIDIIAMHDVGWLSLPQMGYIRNKFLKGSYSVTANCHTISYENIFPRFLAMGCSGLSQEDILICPSNAAQKVMSSAFNKLNGFLKEPEWPDIQVLPFGIDPARFRPVDKMFSRELLNLPIEAKIILWVGRISSIDKGNLLLFLNKILPTIKDQGAIMVVSGADPFDEWPRIQMQLKLWGLENSCIRLNVSDSSRTHLYSAADLFVSPADSVQESFGQTVLEAMACGLPVVVSDWDGYRDIVENNISGYLIPTWWNQGKEAASEFFRFLPWQSGHELLSMALTIDYNEFSEKISLLLEDDLLRKEMSERALLRASQFFWNKIIQKYEDIWFSRYGKIQATPEENYQTSLVHTDIFDINASDNFMKSKNDSSIINNSDLSKFYSYLSPNVRSFLPLSSFFNQDDTMLSQLAKGWIEKIISE